MNKKKLEHSNEMSLDRAIEEYISRGFGSMNKSDFELYIFNRWYQQHNSYSDYEISRELRITESKVKKLKYEAALKYTTEGDEERLNKKIEELLHHVQYRKQSEKLSFLVRDKYLRDYIAFVLEKDGRYTDSSFNSNIVSLYIDDFVHLLDTTTSKETKNKILQLAKERSAIEPNFPKDYKEILWNGTRTLVTQFTPINNDTIDFFEQLIDYIKPKINNKKSQK